VLQLRLGKRHLAAAHFRQNLPEQTHGRLTVE